MTHPLPFLQEAALSLVYKLDDVDRALLVQFNETIKGSAEFTGDISRLENFVQGLQAWGGTSLYDAIQYSLGRIKDQPARKAVLAFTDGAATTAPPPPGPGKSPPGREVEAARTPAPGIDTADGTRARFPLAKPRVTIGRSRESDISLPDQWLSRHHAEIVEKGDGFYLADLQSKN